jgi:hypothetical protein
VPNPQPLPYNPTPSSLSPSYHSSHLPTLRSTRPHIHNAADAVSLLHIVKGLVDLRQRLAVSDELVHLELAVHVVGNQVRQLRAALDATERAALPHAARDELECCESEC